jgi:hypothetical protein
MTDHFAIAGARRSAFLQVHHRFIGPWPFTGC